MAESGAGKLICQRIGCDAVYEETEEGNPEGSCRHHPSPPLFHDGKKEWPCCGKKSSDFSEFMALPGCTYGKHTQEKPPKPAQSPTVTAAQKQPGPSTQQASNEGGERGAGRCLRCEQGFFCSEHAQQEQQNKPAGEGQPHAQRQQDQGKEEVKPDPEEVVTCRNAACGSQYMEKDNHDEACLHHPGPPVFHERQKGWQCCGKFATDFDEFMRIPPCTRGRHNCQAQPLQYGRVKDK